MLETDVLMSADVSVDPEDERSARGIDAPGLIIDTGLDARDASNGGYPPRVEDAPNVR